MIKVWKAIIDTVGHYARPDIVRLQYLKTPHTGVAALAGEALDQAPPDELEAAAERHGVSREDLESALAQLARGNR